MMSLRVVEKRTQDTKHLLKCKNLNVSVFLLSALSYSASAAQHPQRETVTLQLCPIEFAGHRQLQMLCSVNNTYWAMAAGFGIHRKSKPHNPQRYHLSWSTETGKTIRSAEAETHFNHFTSPAVNVISKYWLTSLVTTLQIKGFKIFCLCGKSAEAVNGSASLYHCN